MSDHTHDVVLLADLTRLICEGSQAKSLSLLDKVGATIGEDVLGRWTVTPEAASAVRAIVQGKPAEPRPPTGPTRPW
jgi:hypothetical protein